MASVNYIWEKVMVAVNCLCAGTGPFEERLYNAYISALMRLDSRDPNAELADDLNWVLMVCQRQVVSGEGRMSPVPELDRHKIAEKLVSLLIKSSRMTCD